MSALGDPIPLESQFRHALPFIAFLGPLPFLAAALATLEDYGWRTLLLFTNGRLLWKKGLAGPVHTLDRAAILSVTAHEASAVLHLELTNGDTARLTGLADPLSLVGSLGLPCRTYRRPPVSEEEAWYRSFLFNLDFAVSAIGMFAMSILMLQVFHPVRGPWPLPAWLGIADTLGIGITFILATKLSIIAFLPHFIAARRLDGDALRRFGCRRLNRPCQGREPYPDTDGNPRVRLERAIAHWLIHRFHGGRLDCDCEPEIIEPHELGMDRKP
jgi:hypothetical protein